MPGFCLARPPLGAVSKYLFLRTSTRRCDCTAHPAQGAASRAPIAACWWNQPQLSCPIVLMQRPRALGPCRRRPPLPSGCAKQEQLWPQMNAEVCDTYGRVTSNGALAPHRLHLMLPASAPTLWTSVNNGPGAWQSGVNTRPPCLQIARPRQRLKSHAPITVIRICGYSRWPWVVRPRKTSRPGLPGRQRKAGTSEVGLTTPMPPRCPIAETPRPT